MSKIRNILTKLYSGNKRSSKAKKHISLSLVYRIVDMLIGLIMFPLILTYVTNEEYGIWAVIFSFTNLFNFLNVGLDGGLRNNFAICLAKNDNETAKYYVSTAYISLAVISTISIVLLFLINPFIDWIMILNTSQEYSETVSYLIIFAFMSFFISLVLKLIITLLSADQKPSVANLNNLLQKFLSLVSILILIFTSEGSLFLLGIVFSIVPVAVLLFLSIFYFSRQYKEYKPQIRYFKLKYLNNIMDIGLKIFIIRIAVVVLFTTDNLIITQLFGPAEVTTYQVAHKYFTIPLMIFTVFAGTLWSAVTDAYHRNEIKWIDNAVNKLVRLWVFLSAGVVLMLISASLVFEIWLRGKVYVPFMLSAGWALFMILQTYNMIYVNVINGIGKLKIQLYTAINSMLLNIPLSVYFSLNLKMGVSGVIYATCVSIIISIVLRKIQFVKVMKGTASGLWNE